MNKFRTGDQIWVREHNLSIIMKQLWQINNPVKRSHLTKISGLNKSTIGNLLNELFIMGFVKEVGFADSSDVGRPSSLIDINPDGGRILGIEIGKDFIMLVVSDLKANILWKCKLTSTFDAKPLLEANASQVIKSTEKLITDTVNKINLKKNPLLGIGLGLPAMIDAETGTIINSDVLEWKNIPIRKKLEQRFNVPIFVGNDANVSALGEWMVGVARNVNNFVYISSNVGIGGGLVLDGKLYTGENGFAGEIGHMMINSSGSRCICGNTGCLELYVKPKTILHDIKESAKEGKTPVLIEICDGNIDTINMERIFQAANSGDKYVIDYLNSVARYLGAGIANLIYVLNPKMVVIGGVLSLCGPAFLKQIESEVECRVQASYRQKVPINYSLSGFDSCAVGGVALVLNELLQNPAGFSRKSSH